ncbi:MAG: AAA family ATPase [Acidimicrobiaceae bacterium]|nr:AAA family ATPase [Acidimicrobiaceae bacterium]
MRVHRIRLRNYRGVVESAVAFAERGVTIVQGDNEVGKTSLAHAIDLIFDYRDDTTHRAVKAVQPVGRDAGPEVEVEISAGPYRFVYTKRWLRQRQTTLNVLEPRREQLNGREAHDRVNAILDETLDRPLWRALRFEQGVGLSQSGFDVVSLGKALDAAAGGDPAEGRADDLWDRISGERDRYWTATGQPNRERTKLAAELDAGRGRVEDAERRLRQVEGDADEVARLSSEAATLEETRATQEQLEAELTERYEAVAELRSRLRQLVAERTAAQAEHDGVQLRCDRRAELIEAVSAAADALESRRREADQAEPVRAAARARQAEAQRAFVSAKEARQASEARHLLAVADRDHRRQEIELEQLTERHNRVVAAQDLLVAADRDLESSRVDDDLVVRIELAHLEVAKARAAAESSAAVVRAVASQPVGLSIDGRHRILAAGEDLEQSVHGAFELSVPDLVRIDIRPGGEARALAERLREAEEELATLCKSGEVANLEEARLRASRCREALRSREAAATTIRQDLRDLTLDALAQKIQRLTLKVADYRRRRPSEPPIPPDFDSAQEHAKLTELRLAECQTLLHLAETEAEAASAALQAAAVDDAGLAARIDQADVAFSEAERTLAAARQDCDDSDLRGTAELAGAKLRAAEAAVVAARRELAGHDPDSLDELLANARAAKDRSVLALRVNLERRRELAVRLELLGEEGIAEDVDEAKTRFEHLAREWRSIEARAEAARLLYQSFAERRAEAHQRYVAPFRTKIEQLGRLVFGPSMEVELDDDLRIARRTLDGVTVEFDQLSTGAQEQLGILSRLACAALVAGEGGAPVVFDDALGWSDPRRLDRMGAAINVAARDCQVIVLTCTPGRYAGVGNADVIELSA